MGWGLVNRGIVMQGGNPPVVYNSVEFCGLLNKDIQLYTASQYIICLKRVFVTTMDLKIVFVFT
jgi:hypothetical protein